MPLKTFPVKTTGFEKSSVMESGTFTVGPASRDVDMLVVTNLRGHSKVPVGG